MSARAISQGDLIETNLGSRKYLHLSRVPLDGVFQAQVCEQRVTEGCNIGGRPEGLWFSLGSQWLLFAQSIDTPEYPTCCFLYQINLKRGEALLRIGSRKDIDDLFSRYGFYWLNVDYYRIDLVDRASASRIHAPRRAAAAPKQCARETALSLGYIFDSAAAAISGCEFYKTVDVERFKYPDWSAVARDYSAVVFEWGCGSDLTYYMWFQSLDLSSGCIWDTSVVKSLRLLYRKSSTDTWERAEDTAPLAVPERRRGVPD